jgi:hypothetical protein
MQPPNNDIYELPKVIIPKRGFLGVEDQVTKSRQSMVISKIQVCIIRAKNINDLNNLRNK